ncbi:hypothetical protein [Bacillus pseudomycoides]|nr:hypothetical protein [Bacillus pseudomycoides]
MDSIIIMANTVTMDSISTMDSIIIMDNTVTMDNINNINNINNISNSKLGMVEREQLVMQYMWGIKKLNQKHIKKFSCTQGDFLFWE